MHDVLCVNIVQKRTVQNVVNVLLLGVRELHWHVGGMISSVSQWNRTVTAANH